MKGKKGFKGLYQKHGKWVYQAPQVDGVRPKPVHLKTEDFTEAVRLAKELKKRGANPAGSGKNVGALVEEWLSYKQAVGEHRGATSADTARSCMNSLVGFLGEDRPAADIDAKKVEQWKMELLGAGLSRATVLNRLAFAQGFYRWAVETGKILDSPFVDPAFRKRIANLKKITTRRHLVCTRDQRDLLCHGCAYHADLQAVFFLGFFAGLRLNEILNLRPSNVLTRDGQPRWLEIRNESGADGGTEFTVKDGEKKVVPIAEPLLDFLEVYDWQRGDWVVAPHKQPNNSRYRWNFVTRWKTYVTKCGLEWVTPHVMRHTFVSLLLSAPPEKRPSLLHLERWTGTDTRILKKTYAHLFEDEDLINAAN